MAAAVVRVSPQGAGQQVTAETAVRVAGTLTREPKEQLWPAVGLWVNVGDNRVTGCTCKGGAPAPLVTLLPFPSLPQECLGVGGTGPGQGRYAGPAGVPCDVCSSGVTMVTGTPSSCVLRRLAS